MSEPMDRRVKFAWAKYYEEVRHGHNRALDLYRRQSVMATEPTLPTHIKAEIEEMAKSLRKEYECPICLDMIAEGQLDITICGHKYCKPCLTTMITQSSPNCAVCRKVLKHR